jgi:CO/xanthine dehydrogenase Mo-binding subunit
MMDVDNFQVVGKGYPRHEAVDKVNGNAVYTDDMIVPNMVYGAILRSPHAHARVLSIDTSEAEKIPGILGVLVPDDVSAIRYNCSGTPPSPLVVKDERILTDHPLHVGDRIAAVAATSPRLCREALSRISVVYKPLPPLFDIDRSIEKKAPLLHPETSDSNIFKKIEAHQGDMETGFGASELVMEGDFETPGIFHVCLETVGCICDYSREGKVTIWSNSQTPFQERRILAELLEMPESRIRIIKPVMGGGFGSRQQLHNQPVGVLLSKRVKRPVKIVNTREEEMVGTCVRHASRCSVKAGVSADGFLQAFHAKVYHNTGAYGTHGPIVLAAQSRKLPYRTPHYRYEGNCVYTHSPVAGAMRGYGNPQLTFAREVLFDRIARKLKMDPVRFRLQNRIRVGDTVPGSPLVLESCALRECIEAGEKIREKIDEAEASEPERRNNDIVASWGVAMGMHTSGPSNNTGLSSAVILVHDDGSANLLTGSADMGQGSETALCQIVAEVLGIGLSDVTVTAADTLYTPYETGSFASSQAYVAGNAVKDAAENVIAQVREALAEIYDVQTARVVWKGGLFRIIAGEKETQLNFKEAISRITFDESGAVVIGRSSFKAQQSAPPFAVCWAKAAFDRLTQSIDIRHVIQAVDVGTAINPDIVTGQIEGGVMMGLGYALMEQVEIDRRTAKPSTNDLLAYKIPSIMEMPEIHTYIAKSYEPTGPLGAKSVGEMTTIAVAPAVVNAVAAASGQDIGSLPLTKFYNIKHRS